MIDRPNSAFRRYLLPALLALFVLEMAVFTALQYRAPLGLASLWYVSHQAPDHFAHAIFGRAFSMLSDRDFRADFRILLIAIYITYAVTLIWLRRLPAISSKKALTIVALIGIAVAVFFPPSLSADIYSYIAYAELPFRHLNPYFHSPQVLIDAGDPIARFLPKLGQDPTKRHIAWDLPSVYGPVWTLLSMAVVKIAGGLWAAAVGMKLIEAAALVIAAHSAGRIARRNASGQEGSGRAGAAILMVGLNPLALVEGVGSGHNDLLMMAFALLAVARLQERRPALGGLALGVSVGIKFVTLGLLPWLLIDWWKTSAEKTGRLRSIAAIGVGAMAPTILCYTPFWRGFATLGALANRNHALPNAAGAAASTPAHPSLLLMLHDHQTVLIVYIALTITVALSRMRDAWVLAWVMFSAFFIYYSMGVWFPWYLLWPWLILLACGMRMPARHALSFLVGALALTLSTFYTISSGLLAMKLIGAAFWASICLIPIEYYVGLLRAKKN